MPAGFHCSLCLVLCLLMGSLIGCQFDSSSGSHLIWADRNTVGRPAVLMESVRRDSYRREPPQQVVPDQQLIRVHADPMLFGPSSFSTDCPLGHLNEELPPRAFRDVERDAGSSPAPSVSKTELPDAGPSFPAAEPSPLESAQPSPAGTDSSGRRAPEPSLPQDVPRLSPPSSNGPASNQHLNPPDDELHQAAFRLPSNDSSARAGNGIGYGARPTAPRQPVGGWLFSN